MSEKLASAEIAESRRTKLVDLLKAYDDDTETLADRILAVFDQAERDTRERCAHIVENEPLGYITESEHEKLERFADRVAERIRGVNR